jgi:hypothetical protein
MSRKPAGAWGCISAVDSQGRTIWIADAHRGDGKRFIVRADEKLAAFLELEAAISRVSGEYTCINIRRCLTDKASRFR